MRGSYILVCIPWVSNGNVFKQLCQLHLMLFIIVVIYELQSKTKLQITTSFCDLGFTQYWPRLPCNLAL